MNVAAELLARGAPEAPALLQAGKTVTYDELRQRAFAIAARLQASGLGPGHAVALLADNGAFFVAGYLGILLVGAVAVPVSPDLPVHDLHAVLADAESRCLLASDRQSRKLGSSPLPEGCACLRESEFGTSSTGLSRPVEVDPVHGVAALMFTSGSTGRPKGVVVTHRNIACNTRDIVEALSLTETDRAMLVLPLHYCFGLSVLHTHLAVGASVVINNQFLYPQSVLDDLRRSDCTGFAGVPSHFQILLRKSRWKQMDFPALRWLQQAGGKLPDPFIREILEAFPRLRFYTMYGQTEATARLSVLPPDQLPAKLGSIGRGLPSTCLRVVRPDGSEIPPGSEEIGEIVATGDNITLGYWRDPAETERWFRDGGLHTGDLARRDADGFLFVVEREREMIKAGGNRVSAKQVEGVLSECPEVVEAAVVAMPHPLLGEAIAAFVTLGRDAAIGEEQLRDHCRRRLAVFQVPELLRILPRLPHTSQGKIHKAELRHLAASLAPSP